MKKKEFNKLIKEAVSTRFDSPEGLHAIKRIHNEDPAYYEGFERGVEDALDGIPKNENPYMEESAFIEDDVPVASLIRGWNDGWQSVEKERLKEAVHLDFDSPEGMIVMKNIHTQKEAEKELKIAYEDAYDEGVQDAEEGVPRKNNPYLLSKFLTTLVKASIKGWYDGWDSNNRRKGLKESGGHENSDDFGHLSAMKRTHVAKIIKELDFFIIAYMSMAVKYINEKAGGARKYSIYHISYDTVIEMANHCKDFQKKFGVAWSQMSLPNTTAGWCFWYSRNNIGDKGFANPKWWPETPAARDLGKRLHHEAVEYGPYGVYVADRGIYKGLIVGHQH